MEKLTETKVENEPPVDDNPYAYLERDFSSENFKIEIKNLPKFYGIGEFKKLLNDKLKLSANKVKAPGRNSRYAFVCFRNAESRDSALCVLNDYKWKGKSLQAMLAKPSADPLVKKRKAEASEDCPGNKKLNLSVAERVQTSTIPLFKVDYTEQLKTKQESIKNLLGKLANSLAAQNVEIRSYIEAQKAKFDGLPCELLEIRYSDIIDGYRNKCEFSVGINSENQLPTVGFRVGAYVNGITGVGPVDHLSHIPNAMKTAVKVFEQFVRSSKLAVFNAEVQSGNFKQITVRVAPDQLMVVVGIHPQKLTLDEIDSFKKDLISFFVDGDGKEAKVTSLYYEEIIKKNPGEWPTPATHLWGEPYIYETIMGLKFRISPAAFFQINTNAAEILYKTAIELAEPTVNSTMLDICCGTGTIGLCFAKQCGQVLGLEVVPQAIIDAKENASYNDIENSEFFTGKAEEILGSMCYNSKFDDVFAVVDPPRAGLHQKAIQQLRKINKINRVVYISCNPQLAFKNFTDLGRPESKYFQGECFVPIRAVAVDLFPHTNHCELVVAFKRWDVIKKAIEEGK